MQRLFTIESSHLTYHLEGLSSLLLKTADGKYALSSLGEAAVSTMKHVEEPPKATLHLRFPSKSSKPLMAAMLVGIVLLSTLLVLEYQGLIELSNQYSSLNEEHKLLEEALRESLHIRDSVLTYKHTVNDTIATALLKDEGNVSFDVYDMNGTFLARVNESAYSITTPWGHNIDNYFIYSLTSNSTLEAQICFQCIQPQAYLFMRIWEARNWTEPSGSWYEEIRSTKVTDNTTFSVPLPSRGRYVIQIWPPFVWNSTDHLEITYTMALSIESQVNYAPFFAGNRAEQGTSGSFSGPNPDQWPMLIPGGSFPGESILHVTVFPR